MKRRSVIDIENTLQARIEQVRAKVAELREDVDSEEARLIGLEEALEIVRAGGLEEREKAQPGLPAKLASV